MNDAFVGAASAANDGSVKGIAPDGAPTASAGVAGADSAASGNAANHIAPGGDPTSSGSRRTSAPPDIVGAALAANRAFASQPGSIWQGTLALVVFVFLAVVTELLAPGSAQAALPEQIARIKPSVVAVGTRQRTRSPQFSFRGTGFVVGDGTLIATNAHVVPDTIESDKLETIAILASVGEGPEVQVREAKLAGLDREHDLALLRISGVALPALVLGDSDAMKEGEAVAFTGFPIGNVLGFHAVTHRAIVASITPIVIPTANSQQLDAKVIRRVQAGSFNVFQLDAIAYPGNSGSPLFDIERGEVVGIINMVFVKGTKEAALTNPTGISFAIPSTHLDVLLRAQAPTAPLKH